MDDTWQGNAQAFTSLCISIRAFLTASPEIQREVLSFCVAIAERSIKVSKKKFMTLYKYTHADYALDALRSKCLKVATILDANDPNEWLPVINDPSTGKNILELPEWHGQFRYRWGSLYGFISLSSKWDNLPMWGHYANNSSGAVICFDVIDDSRLLEVRYQHERVCLNVFEQNQKNNAALASRKDRQWAYESEWRCLVTLENCTTKRIDERTIYFYNYSRFLRPVGLIIGTQSSLTQSDVASTCPQTGFVLRKLKHANETFALNEYFSLTWDGKHWTHV